MKQFLSRASGWAPVILVITGGLAMIAGLFSIRAMAVSSADITVPPHAAVYVGGGTCYTCHTGDFEGWAVPVDLQAMADVAAKPKQVIADVMPREAVPHVDVDEFAHSCATGMDSAPLAGSKPRQYVIKTDTGVTLLPLQWNEQKPETPDPDAESVEGTDCIVDLPGNKSSGVQWTSNETTPSLRIPHVARSAGYAHRRLPIRIAITSETAFVEGQSA